ncbi:MAG: hypothetical protein ACRDUY_06560, partial [Nitriliruptorales bacterium]
MNSTQTRRRAATSLAAAALALAMTAPGAHAAGPSNFEGAAEALAFDLSIAAPGGLLDPLGAENGVVNQRISQTLASLSSSGKADGAATLLDGVLNQLTDGKVADQCDGRPHEILGQDAGILSVGVGRTQCEVSPSLSRTYSQLAEVRVSIAGALPSLPGDVAGDLQRQVDEAISTVEAIVGELNGVLTEVEAVVNETAEEAEENVPVDIPELSLSQLPAITISQILENDLVYVQKLWSESVVKTEADTVVSDAKAGIVEARLLGGMVRIPAFTYSSVASTNGRPGGGAAEATTTHVAVELPNANAVSVQDGVLSVNDTTIDLSALEGTEAPGLLAEVEGLLTEIVNAAGIDVSEGKGETFVAEDGSEARASTSAFAIAVAPLNALSAITGEQQEELAVNLNLLPTSAAVAASPAVVEPAAPSLPRTGGGSIAVVL